MSNPFAFPGPPITGNGCVYDGGMTLLDYFAAHAPQRIPAWFAPAMPLRPELPDINDARHGLTVEDRKDWRDDKLDWSFDECSPALKQIRQTFRRFGWVGPEEQRRAFMPKAPGMEVRELRMFELAAGADGGQVVFA